MPWRDNTQLPVADCLGGRISRDWCAGLREFALIARDPILFISLLFCGLFLFIFVVFPLFRGTGNGFCGSGQSPLVR